MCAHGIYCHEWPSNTELGYAFWILAMGLICRRHHTVRDCAGGDIVPVLHY